jgi:hypothetical protein
MSAIEEKFGAGGVGLQPGHGDPDLATSLRDVADDLADFDGASADWSAALVVAADTVTLAKRGVPIAVEATVGGSTGVKAIVYSAAGAGEVQVVFAAGVATLNFAGADAVTECRVLLAPQPAAIRTTKA